MTAPAGYAQYKTLTVSKTNVASDLAGQRVYFFLNADADVGAVCLSNLHDVIFTDASDNLLPFWRKQGVVTGGAATAHFWLVADLTTATDTTLRMYFQNAGASDTSSGTSVFPTSSPPYRAALNTPDGTTLSVADTSGNLTPTNHTCTATSGVTGGLASFGGTDYIDAGSISLGAAFTAAVLVKLSGTVIGAERILETDFLTGFFLGTGLGASNFLWIVNNNSLSAISGGTADTNLHRLVGTCVGTTGTLYVDGVSVASSTVTNPGSTTKNMLIGKYYGGSGNNFTGTMGAVHVSNTNWSADQIKFDAANLLNSGNEITVGSATIIGVTSTIAATGANSTCSMSATFTSSSTGTIAATGANSTCSMSATATSTATASIAATGANGTCAIAATFDDGHRTCTIAATGQNATCNLTAVSIKTVRPTLFRRPEQTSEYRRRVETPNEYRRKPESPV